MLLHHAARLLKLGFSVTMILSLVPMPITKRGGVLLALLRYTSLHYIDKWPILSSTCTNTKHPSKKKQKKQKKQRFFLRRVIRTPRRGTIPCFHFLRDRVVFVATADLQIAEQRFYRVSLKLKLQKQQNKYTTPVSLVHLSRKTWRVD
jgi:hypothetical protein